MSLKHFYIVLLCLLCYTQASYSQQQTTEKFRTHIVGKGETAYSIATLYNISLQDLYSLNPEAEKTLKVDEVLRVPAEKIDSKSFFFHSIQAKETLYSVSKHYNVPIDQIVAINPGLSSESFRMGNVIRIPSQTQPTEFYSQTEKKEAFTKHTVAAKETLYSLSKQYNVTVEDIADANPEIKASGLKKDMVLYIPKPKILSENKSAATYTTVSTQTTPQTYANNTQNVNHNTSVAQDKSDVIKVGLLLPLLDQKDHQRDRFIEYYEGFLLAVQDIKAKGYSAEIYTFDISKGKNTKKLESLLDTYEMKNLDIVIGGVTDSEISILKNFSSQYNVKYAVPFPVKNESIQLKGSDEFQVNIPMSQLHTKAAYTFCKQFRDYNVIIIEEADATLNDKADFIAALKKNISISALKSQTVQISKNFESQLKAVINNDSKNIIVPASSKLSTLAKVIPSLRNVKNQNQSLTVNLFGYPDWQAYSVQYLQDFFRYGTYIYSAFYADSNDPKVQDFMTRFRSWYGKALMNTYPKYGLLGYDIGLYFMTALSEYGKSFENRLYRINVPTLQSAFNFEKTDVQSGYINTGMYFIHYTTDATIEKIDLSR